MPRRRPLLCLAMLAALVMAPSSMSAAAPSALRNASVSPGSGDTATVFVLEVRYRAPASDPAAAVTASVAGITIPLTLISGSATDGTWQASSLLPAGTWSVTFQAVNGDVPPPSAVYGPVTVDDTWTPSKGPSSDPTSSFDGPPSGGSTLDPAPLATPTPQPSAATAPRSTPTQVAATPHPAVTVGSTEPGSGKRPRPRSSAHPDPSPSPDGAPGAGARRGPRPDDDPIDPPSPTAPWPWALAAGVLALAGSAVLLMIARRNRQAGELADGGEEDLAARAVATVDRRAMRRARLREPADPILAGMGLDEEPPATEASPTRRRGGPPRP